LDLRTSQELIYLGAVYRIHFLDLQMCKESISLTRT